MCTANRCPIESAIAEFAAVSQVGIRQKGERYATDEPEKESGLPDDRAGDEPRDDADDRAAEYDEPRLAVLDEVDDAVSGRRSANRQWRSNVTGSRSDGFLTTADWNIER